MKKGWNINIDARSIHHDPTIHSDPDVFNPSRFPVSLFLPSRPLFPSCLIEHIMHHVTL